MGINARVFQRLSFLASFVFLLAFLGASVYLFAKPDKAIDWYMSLKNQAPVVNPTNMPQTNIGSAQPTPLPVVFANEALGGEYTASGVVEAFDTQTKDLWLKSLDGQEATTKWSCEGEVDVLNAVSGDRKMMEAQEAEALVRPNVQVFGKCNTVECTELVSNCMVILQ